MTDNDFFYGWEKFHKAIDSLTSRGAQRERLVNAYLYSLIHVEPHDVPEEIRGELEQFHKEMTRVAGKADEGSVQVAVDSMSDDQVDRMVKRVVSMHDIVTRYQPAP